MKFTNLAKTGKQPHSCPPARTGQRRSQASLKAFFQRSNEKFTCSSSAELDVLRYVLLTSEATLALAALAAADCIWGVRVCSKRQHPIKIASKLIDEAWTNSPWKSKKIGKNGITLCWSSRFCHHRVQEKVD